MANIILWVIALESFLKFIIFCLKKVKPPKSNITRNVTIRDYVYQTSRPTFGSGGNIKECTWNMCKSRVLVMSQRLGNLLLFSWVWKYIQCMAYINSSSYTTFQVSMNNTFSYFCHTFRMLIRYQQGSWGLHFFNLFSMFL